MKVSVIVDGIEIITEDDLLTSRDGSVYYDRCVALVELTINKAILLVNTQKKESTNG